MDAEVTRVAATATHCSVLLDGKQVTRSEPSEARSVDWLVATRPAVFKLFSAYGGCISGASSDRGV